MVLEGVGREVVRGKRASRWGVVAVIISSKVLSFEKSTRGWWGVRCQRGSDCTSGL